MSNYLCIRLFNMNRKIARISKLMKMKNSNVMRAVKIARITARSTSIIVQNGERNGNKRQNSSFRISIVQGKRLLHSRGRGGRCSRPPSPAEIVPREL